MRVAFVNWADFSAGALFGGGVNGYLQSLALELKARGHDMISLTGGWTYVGQQNDGTGRCRLRRMEDFEGVSRFEIINSPVIAPGIFQARDPEREIAAPALEAVFKEFVMFAKPDVVHFHNIEGFSAGCVEVLKSIPEPSRPVVVFSLHNYHTICPQVYLMRAGRNPCRSFEGGQACTSCVQWPDARREVDMRRGLVHDDPKSVDEEHSHSSHRRIEDTHLTPFENDPDVEQLDVESTNGHARRRRAMIQMLNACDSVLAVSSFVQRKFIAMGVDRSKIARMNIGTSLAGVAPRRTRPSIGRRHPIRLAFMGYHNYYKGLHMLVDSLLLLDPQLRRRLEFHVLAKDLGDMTTRLRSMQESLAGVVIHGEYRRHELPTLLENMDIGVVPSVWWDNGPQTVMEFLSCGIPVLGAEVGGIPDLVRHGENGWLFRGNDREALTALLSQIAEHPSSIAEATANISAMISIEEHAQTMIAHYEHLRIDRHSRVSLS